ncbi:MAG: iron-containing alcohol dehydrogenase family protein [Lachnospiraceae bacterium]|nr:iron-containing alcohol dehydrogenase family protein [Lachnospiraceae bacterium]
MSRIKTPENYINEPDIIKKAGEYIKVYGRNAIVVGGKTALEVTESELYKSLEDNGIEYSVEEFKGFPTIDNAKKIALSALEHKADVLIAVGGGKVMDVTKVAGDFTGLPVVTIPTIVATCASWAAVSVIYNDEGDFEKFYQNRFTPRLILVDSNILVNSPERFWKAGIVDTYAKWYEVSPGLKGKDDALTLKISSFGAKLAYDILDENAQKALEDVREHTVSKEVTETIDAIIFLAGYVGSFVGEKAYSGFAHPFYHSSRRIASTRHILHGELVSYGILAQLVLENKPEEYINETIDKFDKFDVAFTLKDIGLEDNKEEKLDIIADRALREFSGFTKLGFGNSVDEIKVALFKADELVRKRKHII